VPPKLLSIKEDFHHQQSKFDMSLILAREKTAQKTSGLMSCTGGLGYLASFFQNGKCPVNNNTLQKSTMPCAI
jgi:hypothetical protein